LFNMHTTPGGATEMLESTGATYKVDTNIDVSTALKRDSSG
jgi:hypothetical protein